MRPTRIRDKKMKKTFLILMLAIFIGGFSTPLIANELIVSDVTEISVGDEWDDLLDEYEKTVDQFIKLLKKLEAGDESVIDEYERLDEKEEIIADKLDDAIDELTDAQLKRFEKIEDRLIEALGIE